MSNQRCPVMSRRHLALVDATDAELLACVAAGDEAAFEVIMRRHDRRLFRAIRSLVRDDAQAEEALQETYVNVWRALRTFRAEAEFSTWMTRIAINEAYALQRRPTVPTVSIDACLDEDLHLAPCLADEDPRCNPEHATLRSEVRELLEHAIEQLSEPFRAVFMLRSVHGLSVVEAARALKVSDVTVRTRHLRARRALQKILGDEAGLP